MTKNCLYCKTEFEAKRTTAQFCSANCLVKHSKTDLTKTLKEIIPSLKTAAEVAAPASVAAKLFIADPPTKSPGEEAGEWVLDFCKRNKINVEAFQLWVEDNYGKRPEKPAKGLKEVKDSGDRSSFSSNLRKAKCGF